MDVLTDVLQHLRLHSLVYGRMEFSAPWGLRFPDHAGHPHFYLMSRGSCRLELDGEPPVELGQGDLAFLPHGSAHVLRDKAGSKVQASDTVVKGCGEWEGSCSFKFGGGGQQTGLLGGFFRFEQGAFRPFIQSLPKLIHVREDGKSAPWFDAVRKLVLAETAEAGPGSKIMVSRLADILFIQALRAHMSECQSKHGGWIEALKDPKVGSVLSRIHQNPEQDWSVESLAEAAGMSRSAFAARFSALVGEAPLAYLTRWRMDKAEALLARQEPVGRVAKQVGYASSAAFSKAFKRQRGSAPGGLRKAPQKAAA